MPSTPPRGDEQDQIPEQIIVGNQEQPLGDPSPGIPEPSQTPRQTPQVYIAGTIPSRLTLERSPSLPRNFRPSEFAFMPQPDFESAREPPDPSKDDDETKVEAPKKTGAEQLLSSGDIIFQAPMRPLDVARTSYLDYTKTQSIKFYNKGCEKLSGEPFNGKMLLTWLVQVQDKARMFTWIPIMTIKGKLLTQQFADISMEEVREHAQVYQDRAARDAQNAEMLIQCLKASISRKVYNKVYLQKEKYTITRRNTHEVVEDGVCFLKTIIDNYYSNTRSSTKQIRKQLAQLNYYMRNVAKGDVSRLCEHTRELIYELNAAGETTNDLLANLIEALKEAPDVNFQRWLSNQVDLWSMRKLDWKQDGSDLMDEAEVYYQEAINTHRWGKKTHKQDVVYAFKTEESESEVEKQPSNSYEDTIKALAAQMKEYAEAYTAKWGNPSTSDDKKYAWKLIPPKDNEPSEKRMYTDGKSKVYHWCPHHLQWTIHSPSECKRQPSRMRKKNIFKKANKAKKKKEDFRLKKSAYLQAKAAYQACLLDSDEDEESSNSDNDEDSNRSFSDYSSEGSNDS